MNKDRRRTRQEGRGTGGDSDLYRAFAGLRDEDRSQAPSFEKTSARARSAQHSRDVPWSTWLIKSAAPAGFVLVCLVSILTLADIGSGPDAELIRLAEELGTWRAPTSTLSDDSESFWSTEATLSQASWKTPTDSLFVELASYRENGS